ncbi:MAG: FAD:protein FMN transferase, partial [Thermoguttaceae bacterium]|nr:FAD:protein FMN transferase [Thermoguttaceae bacterium]
YSHVIDPRSGKPAAGVLSTTVLAPTAALADALSTAFFVLGPEKTELYCQTHPDVQTLMILEEERHPGYRLFPVNLTPDIFRLLEPEEQKNE